jgi:beta-galactosidase
MSSGYESGGYGLVNLDGTLTERAVQAGEIARIVDANQELLIHSRPVPARVGIVYERMAQLVGGPRGGGDNYHDHLVGYYRVFAENNIPVEFVHASDLEAGDVSQYELLIVPYPLMMTRKAADGLEQFVEQGGYAVAEARLGWNDERGFSSEILPGLGLHEVFGVREQDAWMAGEVSLAVQDSSHPAFARLDQGDQLRGTMFANTVRTLSPDAKVLATINGEPAVVSSRYGQGQTVFVGSFVGAGTHQATQTASLVAATNETVNTGGPSSGAFVMPENNVAFVLGLADWAGIERPVSTTLDGTINPPLVARLHDTPEGQLLFLISYHPAPQQAGVEVTVKENGRYTLRDLLTGEQRTATAEGNRLRLQTSLASKGVQVWELERVP